jgi:stage V sporulation protein D (sporulation-specific penicillin-binding protein)
MDDPRYIVLVALDTPSRETGIYISGGVMAAPTVGAVMADVLPYLGVAREDAAGRTMILEDLTGLTRKEAEQLLKAQSLTALTEGAGDRVTGQIPAPGTGIPGGSQVLLYFGEVPESGTTEVPDFTGMQRQEAADAAQELGLYIRVTGNTEISDRVTAVRQDIPAGTQVAAGTTVTLEFTDTKAVD